MPAPWDRWFRILAALVMTHRAASPLPQRPFSLPGSDNLHEVLRDPFVQKKRRGPRSQLWAEGAQEGRSARQAGVPPSKSTFKKPEVLCTYFLTLLGLFSSKTWFCSWTHGRGGWETGIPQLAGTWSSQEASSSQLMLPASPFRGGCRAPTCEHSEQWRHGGGVPTASPLFSLGGHSAVE